MRSLLVWLLLLPSIAAAQAFPERPIRLIVPYPAGGPTDLMGRMIGEKLTAAWGKPVILENRPGAGGNVGTHLVAQAAPDGHTIAITGVSALAVNVSLYRSIPYDPRKDFTPITKVVDVPTVLVVPDTALIRSVRGLVDQARAAPGRLNFASPSSGTINHLLGEMLRILHGVDIVHVPFKGNPQATESLLRGDTHFMFDNISSALPHLYAGKLRALAATGPRRVAELPYLPTMTELGFPGFEATAWFAIVGPRGMPPGVAARLNAEIVRILREPEFAARVERFGMHVSPGTGPELAALIEADIARWGELVRVSGARAD